MELRQFAHSLLGNLDEVHMVFHVIGRTPGSMLDVGAHQGMSLMPFLRRGWTVYAFEPDPSNRAILERRCPGAIIDPRAISETDGEEVYLYTSDVSTGISTLSPFHATHQPGAAVRTVRLDTYIMEQAISRIDFLKTDVEGYDLFALRTFPWVTHHPKAVVCEFEDHKTERLGHNVHDIANFLEQRGYSVLVSEWEPVAEYGMRHKWRRFVRYPTDLPSDSWGNLVAVEPSLLRSVERAGRWESRRVHLTNWVHQLRGVARS